MAVKVGMLNAILGADTSGFRRGMSEAEASAEKFAKSLKAQKRELEKFGKELTSIGKTMSVAITAPLVALGALSVAAFAEEAEATAKLKAALQASGQEVDKNLKGFKKFAAEMQNVSTVGDETTLRLLQMATSMGLSSENSKRAAKNAIALSKALGVDEEAALKMAAALERGNTTMLSRVLPLKGIKDETEKTAEAQRLLANMFGTVTAEAQSGMGPMLQMKDALGDLMEGFGEIILEAINPFVNWIKELAIEFQGMDAGTKKIIVVVAALALAIGPLLAGFGFLTSTILPALLTGFAVLTGPIGLVIIAVAIAATEIIRNWDSIVKYFTTGPALDAWNTFKSTTEKIFGSIPGITKDSGDILLEIWDGIIAGIIRPFKTAMDFLIRMTTFSFGVIGDVIDVFRAVFAGDWAGMWNEIKSITVRFMKFIIDSIIAGLDLIMGGVGGVVSIFNEDWAAAIDKSRKDIGKWGNDLIKSGADLIGFKGSIEATTTETKGFTAEIKEASAPIQTLDKDIKTLTASFEGLSKAQLQAQRDAMKARGEGTQRIEPMQVGGVEEMELPDISIIASWKNDVILTFAEMADKIAGIVSGIADKIGQIWGGISSIFDQSMKNQMISLENRYGKEREEIQATMDALNTQEENRLELFASEQERLETAMMNDEEKSAALERLRVREKKAAEDMAKAKKAAAEKAAEMEKRMAEERKKLTIKAAQMDKASGIISAIVNTAVAVTKAIAASPLTGGLPFSAIVGALGAAQIALIAAQPIPMAKGGIAMEATSAIIGEAGPEAVIPLDKFPDLFSGENFELRTVLRGEDIELILQRRNKSLGFLK